MWQLAADIATWRLAANSTPLPQACGARRTPCAEVSAAIRRISVMPPARATSGWAMSRARRSQGRAPVSGASHALDAAAQRGARDGLEGAHVGSDLLQAHRIGGLPGRRLGEGLGVRAA